MLTLFLTIAFEVHITLSTSNFHGNHLEIICFLSPNKFSSAFVQSVFSFCFSYLLLPMCQHLHGLSLPFLSPFVQYAELMDNSQFVYILDLFERLIRRFFGQPFRMRSYSFRYRPGRSNSQESAVFPLFQRYVRKENVPSARVR